MSAELRRRAVALLARREHSRAELAQRLGADGAAAAEVAAVLDALERDGYLSDARFAEAFVAARGSRFGPARLRHDLRARGVAEPLIAAAVGAACDESQLARAVWARRFAELPHDPREYARQARFLQGRGFAGEVVRRLLSGRER